MIYLTYMVTKLEELMVACMFQFYKKRRKRKGKGKGKKRILCSGFFNTFLCGPGDFFRFHMNSVTDLLKVKVH